MFGAIGKFLGYAAGAKAVVSSVENFKENAKSGSSIASYGVAGAGLAVAGQAQTAEELIVSGFMLALSVALFFYRKQTGGTE
jgi:hypothetical protein